VLAGLGVGSVSVAAGAVEAVRGALRTVTSEQAKEIAAEVLAAASSTDAKKTAHDALARAVSGPR